MVHSDTILNDVLDVSAAEKKLKARRRNSVFWRSLKRCFVSWNCLKKAKSKEAKCCILTLFEELLGELVNVEICWSLKKTSMSYKQSMWMHILVLFIHSHINIYTKLVYAYFIQISQINKTNTCTWTYIIPETSGANSSVCSLYLNSYNHLLQNYTVTYVFVHIQSHICSFIYSHIFVRSYTVTYVFVHIQSHICSFIHSHIFVPSYTVTYVFLHTQSHMCSFIYSHIIYSNMRQLVHFSLAAC